MFSPLLSSPLCWNPSSFHLAAALVMNYALGSCEIRQESTPTLLRCVCVCMCAQGGLIIKPTSEVVDYEEERCLSTIFHLFFSPANPFAPALQSVPALICNQRDTPTSSLLHRLQFRSLGPPLNPLFSFGPLNGREKREKTGPSFLFFRSLYMYLYLCVCVYLCACVGGVVVWILASSSPLADSPLPWESEVTQTTGHKQEWWNGYWEKIVLLLLLLASSYWLKCVCGCAREHEGSLGNIINDFQLFCKSLKLIDTLTIRKPSSFFMKYITFWLSKRTRIFFLFPRERTGGEGSVN